MGGFDVRRRLGIVAERAPNLAHAHLERAVTDVDVGPGKLEQLILGDELPGAGHEMLQDRKRLRRERHYSIAPAELTSGKVQTEGPERTGGHAFSADYHRFRKVQGVQEVSSA